VSKKQTQPNKRGTSRKSKTPAVKKAAVKDTPEGPDRIYQFADQLTAEAKATETVKTGPEPIWETWVSFRLADEVFAFTVETVHEIIRVGTVTRVPHAPYAVRGIANLRGGVVPVVDLRVRIGLPAKDPSSKSRILITKARDRVLGLLVDSVEQVARVDRNQVTPPPSDVMTEQSEYIIGVTHVDDVLLILLDPEQVLMIPTGLVSPETSGAAA
jgi:purine-binding chemotaxis protein CheW